MGYVTPDSERPGTELQIEIHGRPIPAQVVRLPFYRRTER
jgi:glycine cleavage system aminomethyltransferase T